MAGQNYTPVCPSSTLLCRVIAVPNSNTDTSQVASGDNEESQQIPISPPPSFRSHESSPRNSHERERRAHNRTQSSISDPLADAFDADGSDSDEDNDGDDRQRLMRGTPTDSSSNREPSSPAEGSGGAIQLADARDTPRPVGGTAVQGRVYGGGSGDGVWANLNAKPERGEKLIEEHPPVCYFTIPHMKTYMLTRYTDLRSSSRGRRTTILGDHHPHPRLLRPQRSLHRRPSCRLLLQLPLERHNLHVLPARRLPTHLPPAHHPRCQARLSCRSRRHAHPIRLLPQRQCRGPGARWRRADAFGSR